MKKLNRIVFTCKHRKLTVTKFEIMNCIKNNSSGSSTVYKGQKLHGVQCY